MLKKYVTKITKEDGDYEGPEIIAQSWSDATAKAKGAGAVLLGEAEDFLRTVLSVGTAMRSFHRPKGLGLIVTKTKIVTKAKAGEVRSA